MDYYNVLGINKNATQDEIKKAYRKMSMKYHPDKPSGNEDKFKEINEAYTVLSDKEKKSVYDFTGSKDGNVGVPFGGMNMPFGNFSFQTSNTDNIFENDFFKMFFNGQNNMDESGGPNIRIFRNGVPVNNLRKPTPIIKNIPITLSQAYNGMNYPIEIERWIKQSNNVKITEKEKIYVNIPPGIDENEIIILRNQGNILNDEIKGDIKCFIKIKNDTEFKRSGLNLIYTKDISLKDALCGFSFVLHYIDGKQYTINNTSGKIINPGFKKQINNMGMKRDNQKGNLIIEFNINFPDNLTSAQIKTLQETL